MAKMEFLISCALSEIKEQKNTKKQMVIIRPLEAFQDEVDANFAGTAKLKDNANSLRGRFSKSRYYFRSI